MRTTHPKGPIETRKTQEVKRIIFFFNGNGQNLKVQTEAWASTECRRRPILFRKIKKVTEAVYKRERGPGSSVTGVPAILFGKKSKNVTDLLLVFRQRPFPTTAVLRGIRHCFHRCHRIGGMFERLE